MLYVEQDGTIRLTRGDTARFVISIDDDITGNPYEFLPTDVLTMSIKKSITDRKPCVQKIVTGSNIIHLLPEDTRNLEFENYIYDVQLKLEKTFIR